MMSQMRAILVKNGAGGVESLFLGQASKPKPSVGEVLVKIKAFGLNRMDIMQREGRYPVPKGAASILGVEFSGHVSELGNGVSEWNEGDEVLGLAGGGAYAEYITVPQTHVTRKPVHLSWVEAASIPESWLTAFQALIVLGNVKENENVLIHAGASGVGLSAIQLARFYGAKTVTATASTEEKLEFLRSLPYGATHTTNYKTQDFAEDVKKTTDGKGVDVIVDFVGKSYWQRNIDSLAVDGRMTMLALLSGAEVQKFSLLPILYKRLRIQGSTLRARSAEYQAGLISRFKSEAFNEITGSAGEGKLRTYIHKVYPWTEIQDAHREMEANKNIGKIIAEVV